MKTELEMLEERIKELKRIQRNCQHIFADPEYDPEKKEIMETEIERIGVDIWPVEKPTGRYETVPRWSRTCKKCGFKDYTYTQREVVVESYLEPDFTHKNRK